MISKILSKKSKNRAPEREGTVGTRSKAKQ
jgi:hypothetical protein